MSEDQTNECQQKSMDAESQRPSLEGDPSVNKLHPECSNALDDLVHAEGGEAEYNIYSEERPVSEEAKL